MPTSNFNEQLQQIKNDRSSGAAELARQCLSIISRQSRQAAAQTVAELVADTSRYADQLAAARPSMAPVQNLLRTWQTTIRQFTSADLAKTREHLAKTAESLIDSSMLATRQTARQTAKLTGSDRTVITISYSSTVLAALSLLKGRNLHVIHCESRPLNEGHKLAGRLDALAVRTTLITDSQIGLFVGQADLALVGADSLLADGSVINKAGTYLLALAAYDNNVPLYVCCESYKKLPKEFEPPLEEMDTAELGAPKLNHGQIKNIYFDITPARLITGWCNEEGLQRY